MTRRLQPTASSVHPRPRGEHPCRSSRNSSSCGSSPPARGTPSPAGPGGSQHRFIPARAGNTRRPSSPTAPPTVHPRPRGEHRMDRGQVMKRIGSSPPARGTRDPACECRVKSRFIPARAGNTARRSNPRASAAVHPRPRGEHIDLLLLTCSLIGSSPPARGTRQIHQRGLWHRRFIPARAGNTCLQASRSLRRTVHPRPRGEH